MFTFTIVITMMSTKFWQMKGRCHLCWRARQEQGGVSAGRIPPFHLLLSSQFVFFTFCLNLFGPVGIRPSNDYCLFNFFGCCLWQYMTTSVISDGCYLSLCNLYGLSQCFSHPDHRATLWFPNSKLIRQRSKGTAAQKNWSPQKTCRYLEDVSFFWWGGHQTMKRPSPPFFWR